MKQGYREGLERAARLVEDMRIDPKLTTARISKSPRITFQKACLRLARAIRIEQESCNSAT